MSEYVTKDELNVAMKAQTDEIVGVMQSFMQQVGEQFTVANTRFDSIDTRFDSIDKRLDSIDMRLNSTDTRLDSIDTRLDSIDTRLDATEQKYDRLLNTIDGFIGRIDKYETEQAARDNQFEKLLAWARKVSEKTGIPLENL